MKQSQERRRDTGRKRPVYGYALLGISGIEGVSGCRMSRQTTEKRLTHRNDSVQVNETVRMENRRWMTGNRLERVCWQETFFSPPDSTGRQSIRRVRTAMADRSEKTVSEDTVSRCSFREKTEIREARREEARLQSRQPGNSALGSGIGTGLFFIVLLCLLFRYRKKQKRR